MLSRKATISLLAVLGGVAALAACNILQNAGLTPQGLTTDDENTLSPGRQAAARLLLDAGGGASMRFRMLQRNPADPNQTVCDPLGLGGGTNVPWTTKIAPVTFGPNLASEYDIVGDDTASATRETDYCLALRSIFPDNLQNFTAVEFSLRAVNPRSFGHVPGLDYGPFQADFPSNDDDIPPIFPDRTLVNLDGDDIAILVEGVDFALPPINQTRGFMNTLGPTSWLLFFRDNAFQSGRFYNIVGAFKGGPPAFADTPSPLDDGFFQSAQVRGPQFDALSDLDGLAARTPAQIAAIQICNIIAPGEDPLDPYIFIDLSTFNLNALAPLAGSPSGPGQGSFLLVIRREAWRTGNLGTVSEVVVDPSGPPAPIAAGDLIPAPNSGYNELVIPAPDIADGPHKTNHTVGGVGDGPPGVHELAFTVFFIHT